MINMGFIKNILFPASKFTPTQPVTALFNEISRHNDEVINRPGPIRPELIAASATKVQVASTAYENSVINRVASNNNANYYLNINNDIKMTESNLMNRTFTIANNQHKSSSLTIY